MVLPILLFCLICSGSAQLIGFGACPNVDTISPFDVTKYTGLWYENRRSLPNWFEFGGKCVTANYSENDDGTIKVVNREISQITNLDYTVVGTARPDESQCGNSTGCSKLIVEFPAIVIGNTRGSYWILDTDYTSYSLVWSCTNVLLNHLKFLWILTREQTPPDALIERVRGIMREKGVANIPMTVTDQEHCP